MGTAIKKQVTRNFIVGSEWLYYKLYTGPKTADMVLTEVILPIADEATASGAIEKWFFIRYADPDHHLRVRFHLLDKKHLGPLIIALHDGLLPFLEEDLLWKVQLDTYQRELERYGTQTMIPSETLFYHDSNMVVGFLDLIEGDEGEQLRWLFGLRAADQQLNAFGYSLDKKLVLLEHLKTAFGNEFGMGRPLKKQLDDKYRRERTRIEQFLAFTSKDLPEYAPILELLSQYQQALAPTVSKIKDLVISSIEGPDLDNLLSSYLHMLLNRLFKSKNRLNEMVCYDFLYRHYRSLVSRQKKAP